MKQDHYFAKIETKAGPLLEHLNNLIESNLPFRKHFGFDAIPIDLNWIEEEQSLKEIHNIQPIKALGLLKVPSNSFYNWHVDDFRRSCINMLVSERHDSHCLFSETKDNYYREIIELKYEPETYYLFNNQKQHCVMNLGKNRYLFSLYFEEEIHYPLIHQKLRNNSIIH